MALSGSYVVKEAVTNLWRNRLMTVAAVLTVAVSLALVGSALLLKQGTSNATVQWQQHVDAIVWVAPNATSSQSATIGRQLSSDPFVRTCIHRSQAYDYSEAKRILPAEEVAVLTAADMPSSYRCVLYNPAEASAIKQQFTGRPGVDRVQYPEAQIRTMENVIHVLQWVFLSIAAILLLSAAVLILNTIRMAIFARRREVSVMKLVGATNWFIRLPFMAEGMTQGLLGSAVAVLAVFSLYWGLGLDTAKTVANHGSLAAQMSMGVGEVLVTSLFVLIVGVAVGAVGSALAVRRFLDV